MKLFGRKIIFHFILLLLIFFSSTFFFRSLVWADIATENDWIGLYPANVDYSDQDNAANSAFAAPPYGGYIGDLNANSNPNNPVGNSRIGQRYLKNINSNWLSGEITTTVPAQRGAYEFRMFVNDYINMWPFSAPGLYYAAVGQTFWSHIDNLTALNLPCDLSANAVVLLSWGNLAGVSSIDIYRNGSYIDTVSGITTGYTNDSDSPFPPAKNTAYTYYAIAYAGNRSGSYDRTNSVNVTTLDCSYSVSGTIYNDVDNSGTYNAGDTSFIDGSRTVTLSPGSISGNSSIVNGTYTINGVLNGSYTANLPLPSDYKAVIKTFTEPIDVNGSNVPGINFLVQGYTISGSVFMDSNLNGVKNGSEPFYSGGSATVSISGGPTVPVNAAGQYYFRDLKADIYILTFNVPLNHAATNGSCRPDPSQMPPPACSIATTLLETITISDLTEVDFGLTPSNTITGHVYEDPTGGYCSSSRTPYTGAPLNLTNTATGVLVANSPTDLLGSYSFLSVYSGSYDLSLDVPAGYKVKSMDIHDGSGWQLNSSNSILLNF